LLFSNPAQLFEVSLSAPKKGVIRVQKLAKTKLSLIAISFMLAIVVLSCSREEEKAKAEQNTVDWKHSFDDALRIAQQKNMPVMIDFHADWCGWCKRLDDDTYAHEDVVAKSESFVSLKIDADAERSISQRYRVAALPTILFLDHSGKEIHRVVGYRPAARFVDEMNLALDAYSSKTGS
jgi:thiol:disulfide interchange protein